MAALLGVALSLSSRADADIEDGQPGEAEPVNDYRDDARRLATEAALQYQAGEYEAALDLFVRAGKLYDAPTLKFWQARCLEQLGQLVDAEARYAAVARAQLEPDAPEAFVQAQRDSEKALIQLRKRLPTITIIINQAKDISKVELDGRVLPPPLVGAPVAVDPGTHVVKVTRSSGVSREESLAISESQTQEIHVDFEEPNPAPLAPIIAELEAHGPEPDEPKPQLLTWTAFGVGAVGLGFGVFAGLTAVGKYQALRQNCTTKKCGRAYHSDVDSFRRWRALSTVGYVVGAVGLGAGVTLMLTAPDDNDSLTVHLQPTEVRVEQRF